MHDYPFLFISHDDGYVHIGIIKKFEGQNTKYYLPNNPDSFDSVTELVEHYQQFPVKGPKFEQKLTIPVSIKVGMHLYFQLIVSLLYLFPNLFLLSSVSLRMHIEYNHGLTMCPERQLWLC